MMTDVGVAIAALTLLALVWQMLIRPLVRLARAIANLVEQVDRTAREVRALARWLSKFADVVERRIAALEHPAGKSRATPRPRRPLEVVPPLPPALLEEFTDAHPS